MAEKKIATLSDLCGAIGKSSPGTIYRNVSQKEHKLMQGMPKLCRATHIDFTPGRRIVAAVPESSWDENQFNR
jgi:hypothetical protein